MNSGKLKFRWLDGGVLLGFLAVGGYLFDHLQGGLNYRWDWGAMPQYLLRHDSAAGGWTANVLLQGFFTTLRLSLWATALATAIGFGMSLLRLSRLRFRRWVGSAYVEATRNTPPLVLVFVFYYFIGDRLLPLLGLDQLVQRLSPGAQAGVSFWLAPPAALTAFVSAVLTLAVVEGAYITEIFRSGIQSIAASQGEAAAALGFTRWQRLRHVLLPQSVQRILPPLGGQFISTIKDSAIVSVISIPELTFRGMELVSSTYLAFETWITITSLYFLLTFGCSLAVSRLEAYCRRRRC